VTQPDPTKTVDPHPRGAKYAALIGGILLLLLVAFWGTSFYRFRLVGDARVSFPAWWFMGLDLGHNYLGVKSWLSGVDPYRNDIGDPRGRYSYPPIVLPIFAWCRLFSFKVASIIWTTCIAATIAWAAWVGEQTRRGNGLPRVPFVLSLAVVLWSMPTMFAMERGNGDALVLLAMVGMVFAWKRKPSFFADAIIGFCVALAAWVKVYPLVLLVVLVLARRWRAIPCGLVFIAVIGLVPYHATQGFLIASKDAQAARSDSVGAAIDWLAGRPMRTIRPDYAPIEMASHSLTSYWPQLWRDLNVPSLAQIPGLIGAAACLAVVGAWVMWSFWRSRHRDRWVWLMMLWLTTLATFWMPVSYDYNLFYLPLAICAVWDHRDGVIGYLLLATAAVWWQPLRLPAPMTPELLFFVKLSSLILAGWALVRRLREPSVDAAGEGTIPLEIAGAGRARSRAAQSS
jgi:hypothetical protein